MRAATVIDLAQDLIRCRISIRELIDEFRGLDARELESYAHRGIGLTLSTAELSPLSAIGADGGLGSPWQKAVADSVALVMLWAELAEQRLPAVGQDLAQRTQLLDGMQRLAIAVHREIEVVAGSLGTASPKITALLDRARRRVGDVNAHARTHGDEPAKPTEGASPAEPQPPAKQRPFQVEALLEPALERFERVLDGHYLMATKMGIETAEGTRRFSVHEAAALGACRNGLIGADVASPVHRLLATFATLGFWIGAEAGVLALPGGIAPPDREDPPLDRETALGALIAITELAAGIREIARNRGDKDLVQALTPSLARLPDLERLAAALPAAREGSGQLAFQTLLSVSDFEARLSPPDGTSDLAPEASGRRARRESEDHEPGYRASKRSKKLGRSQWKALGVAAVSLVLMGLSVTYVAHVLRQSRKPILVETMLREDLTSILPSVVLPATTEGSTEARLGVGPEWLRWSLRERRQRIGQACVVLGNKAWRSAIFLGPDGQPVATWKHGVVTLLDTKPPASSP